MATVTNSFVDTISMTYTGNGKSTSSKIGSYSGRYDAGIAVVVPAGSVNLEFDIVFPHATIQSCVVDADQDLTVNVNSTGTPAPALVVKKTAGIFWGSDFVAANPFTADVTKFYCNNAGTVDARLNVRVLYN